MLRNNQFRCSFAWQKQGDTLACSLLQSEGTKPHPRSCVPHVELLPHAVLGPKLLALQGPIGERLNWPWCAIGTPDPERLRIMRGHGCFPRLVSRGRVRAQPFPFWVKHTSVSPQTLLGVSFSLGGLWTPCFTPQFGKGFFGLPRLCCFGQSGFALGAVVFGSLLTLCPAPSLS